MKKRLIVGISGASGVPIAIELLRALRHTDVESHLIISRGGMCTLQQETTLSLSQVEALASHVYDPDDIGAAPASGTWDCMGMVIVPCSMKTAAGIWSGFSTNLLLRAADVTMKERRKLVLVAREAPLSTVHLRNLHDLSMMGAVILPPMLSYYHHPQSLDDVTRQIAGRILDQFHIDNPLLQRWEGFSREQL